MFKFSKNGNGKILIMFSNLKQGLFYNEQVLDHILEEEVMLYFSQTHLSIKPKDIANYVFLLLIKTITAQHINTS